MKTIFALIIATLTLSAQAADYSLPAPGKLSEQVRYGFDDTVTITPAESGNYSVDVVASTVYGGCSTRYCKSKWSIVTTITGATLGDVNLLPNGNATVPMVAGQSYVLHLWGVGTGTGVYAGYGAWTVSVAKQ